MIWRQILLPCAYKQLFGFSCPLCGFQRAMLLLLEGRLSDSLYQFPIWPIMAVWLMILCVMTLIGRGRKFLHKGWSWTFLLFSLAFNAVWQNVIWR